MMEFALDTETEEKPQEEEEKPQEEPKPEDEPQEQPAEEPKPEEKPKKKGKTFDERKAEIDAATRVMRETERRIAEEKRRFEEEKRKFEEAQVGALKEPNVDDYDDTGKYKTDVAAYYKQLSELNAKKEAAKTAHENSINQKIQQIRSSYDARRQQAVAKDPTYANYDTTVSLSFESNRTHPIVEQRLMALDNATDIVTYLGKNPEKLHKIAHMGAMEPDAALMELGTLKAQLSAKPDKNSQSAPKPISGNEGDGGAASKDWMKQSQSDYEAEQNKKEFGR
jgi:hypothetical protein